MLARVLNSPLILEHKVQQLLRLSQCSDDLYCLVLKFGCKKILPCNHRLTYGVQYLHRYLAY